MRTFACLLFVAATFLVQATAADPPAKLELFAAEAWYKETTSKEQDFVGVLSKIDNKNKIGFGRTNPYRLQIAKDNVREVYVGGKAGILDPYVGKTVKLIGKPVELSVEGTDHREIWPARLEVVPAAK